MKRLLDIARRLGGRLEDRIRLLEREHPDHPIAMYRWLWRALERSSRSRLRLRLRFVALLVQDALLLLVWAVLRPFRYHRSSPLWLTAAAVIVALAWPRSVPDPMETQGPAAEVAEAGRQIEHARIAVAADGLVRFEGQPMTASELRQVVRFFVVRSVSVSVDTTATAGAVSEVALLLRQEGVEAVGPARLNRTEGRSP